MSLGDRLCNDALFCLPIVLTTIVTSGIELFTVLSSRHRVHMQKPPHELVKVYIAVYQLFNCNISYVENSEIKTSRHLSFVCIVHFSS